MDLGLAVFDVLPDRINPLASGALERLALLEIMDREDRAAIRAKDVHRPAVAARPQLSVSVMLVSPPLDVAMILGAHVVEAAVAPRHFGLVEHRQKIGWKDHWEDVDFLAAVAGAFRETAGRGDNGRVRANV